MENIYKALQLYTDFKEYIPISQIYTSTNILLNVSNTASDIFCSISKYILESKFSVDLIFYSFWTNCDAFNIITKCILKAISNFKPSIVNPKFIIRIIISESNYLKNTYAIQLLQTYKIWNIRPEFTDIQLYIIPYNNLGSSHSKYIVIDNFYFWISGSNVQSQFNFSYSDSSNWSDISLIFKGLIAQTANIHTEYLITHLAFKINTSLNYDFLHYSPNLLLNLPNLKLIEVQIKDYIPLNYPVNLLLLHKPANDKILFTSTNINESYNNHSDKGILLAMLSCKKCIYINTPNISDYLIIDTLKDLLHNTNVNICILTNYYSNYVVMEHFQNGCNNSVLERLVYHCDICFKKYKNKKLQIKWYSFDGINPVKGHSKNTNHSKCMFIDNETTIIGSQNLDRQSFLHSGELNIMFTDSNLTQYLIKKLFQSNWNKGIYFDYV